MKKTLIILVLLFSSSVVADEYDYNFFEKILSSDLAGAEARLEISTDLNNTSIEKKYGYFQPVENDL